VLGNFFEHMSYATAGGMAAELLLNPTFARDHGLSDAQRRELVANGRSLVRSFLAGGDPEPLDEHWVSSPLASGFGAAVLDDDTVGGVPLGWSAIGRWGAMNAAVGRLGGAVRLAGGESETPDERVDLDDGPAGVRQGVFPTPWRCPRFLVSAWVRISGGPSVGEPVGETVGRPAGELEVGLRRRLSQPSSGRPAGDLLAATRIPIIGEDWTVATAELTIDADVVSRGEPIDFFLRWIGPGSTSLVVDRASLMPADHRDGFDAAVVELMAGAAVGQLRWPGGNFVSYYHWRDGVGPVEDRPTYPNRAWGGLEYHVIGTDEYLSLCEMVGARPHITVNSGTGTPEEAAAWVEYCNGPVTSPMGALRARNGHPESYGVTVWEVGNENFADWQGGYVGSTENARRFADFARQMRAASPMELTVLACGNWFDFVDLDIRHDHLTTDHRWHDELLRLGAQEIDLISLHSLPSNDVLLHGCTDREAHESVHAQVVSGERAFLPDLLARCDTARTTGRPPIGLAITEWGPLGDHPGRLNVVNFGGAAYAAALLNMVMRNADRIPMASPNGLMHGGAIKKAGGVIYTDPQFDVIQHYADFVGAVPLWCHFVGPGYDVEHPTDLGRVERDVPYLDVLAAESTGGHLLLAVASRHVVAAMDVQIDLSAVGLGTGAARGNTTADITTLAYPEVTAEASPARPDRFRAVSSVAPVRDGVVQLTVPPAGVVWARIDRQGAMP